MLDVLTILFVWNVDMILLIEDNNYPIVNVLRYILIMEINVIPAQIHVKHVMDLDSINVLVVMTIIILILMIILVKNVIQVV